MFLCSLNDFNLARICGEVGTAAFSPTETIQKTLWEVHMGMYNHGEDLSFHRVGRMPNMPKEPTAPAEIVARVIPRHEYSITQRLSINLQAPPEQCPLYGFVQEDSTNRTHPTGCYALRESRCLVPPQDLSLGESAYIECKAFQAALVTLTKRHKRFPRMANNVIMDTLAQLIRATD